MKKSNIVNGLMALLLLVGYTSCTNGEAEGSSDSDSSEKVSVIPLVMDSFHSEMYGAGNPYRIRSTDSIIFDISKYNFRFDAERYDFIREAIAESYVTTFPGSFSSADIIYNDSMRFWIAPKKVIDDKIFAFPTAMDSLKKVGVKKFDLVFTYYLDNGFGSDDIDVFPVEIID